jgi:hypothetical protein
MLCQSVNCKHPADRVVHWPGQSTAMCGSCAFRASDVAHAMGFEMVVGKLEDWPVYKRLVQEAAERLSGAPSGQAPG